VFGNEMGKVEDTVEVDEEWKVFLARRAIRVAEARAERLRESMELAGAYQISIQFPTLRCYYRRHIHSGATRHRGCRF
jgi:hypothetical protein